MRKRVWWGHVAALLFATGGCTTWRPDARALEAPSPVEAAPQAFRCPSAWAFRSSAVRRVTESSGTVRVMRHVEVREDSIYGCVREGILRERWVPRSSPRDEVVQIEVQRVHPLRTAGAVVLGTFLGIAGAAIGAYAG